MRSVSELLTDDQRAALSYVERRAVRRRSALGAELELWPRTAGVSDVAYREALDRLRKEARVVLAFHPERMSAGGRIVAQGLLEDGVYRSQFETGISSGSSSAIAGGKRDEWERRFFGGAYHGTGVTPLHRPKYGGLFLVAHPDGPCPRFGSGYLVLRPEVSARCSFTFLGSQGDLELERSGTLDVFEPVMAALLEHVEKAPDPLGVPNLSAGELVRAMREGLPSVPVGVSSQRLGRALDSFVEAQVHGPVDLMRDVESMVIDPSFQGHPVHEVLHDLSIRYAIPLAWHPGFRLTPERVPEIFRGFPTRRLALRVAGTIDGILDPPTLGAAQNDVLRDAAPWAEFGSRSDVLIGFRRLWHVLVLGGGEDVPPAWI